MESLINEFRFGKNDQHMLAHWCGNDYAVMSWNDAKRRQRGYDIDKTTQLLLCGIALLAALVTWL